jgi:hypothetical protein
MTPRWLRKGTRVVFPCEVVRLYDDGKRVEVETPTGLHLGLWTHNLGVTWDRAPSRPKRKATKARTMTDTTKPSSKTTAERPEWVDEVEAVGDIVGNFAKLAPAAHARILRWAWDRYVTHAPKEKP